MNNNHHNPLSCPICRQEKTSDNMMPGDLIPDSVVGAIKQQNPGWTRHDAICTTCLNQAKMQHAKNLLQAEKGHLSDLDRQVLHSIGAESLLSENPIVMFDQSHTWGERLADRVTVTVGSWYFPTGILIFLVSWISLNLLFHPFEPYPIIILTGISPVLASIAALQGPIILMSQRRQARLDRLRAENDYRLNLKAELEIRYLSEEMTHFLKSTRNDPTQLHLNRHEE